MRETRPSGSEGGGAGNRSPYPYHNALNRYGAGALSDRVRGRANRRWGRRRAFNCRQENFEGGSFSQLAGDFQTAIVRLDDAQHRREAESAPRKFRAKKRLEDFFLNLLAHAATAVDDFDLDVLRGGVRRAQDGIGQFRGGGPQAGGADGNRTWPVAEIG